MGYLTSPEHLALLKPSGIDRNGVRDTEREFSTTNRFFTDDTLNLLFSRGAYESLGEVGICFRKDFGIKEAN